MHETEHIARDANGRFVPSQSGNPTRKRPGTRNRATLGEALQCSEPEKVVQVVIDKALAGDGVAARFGLALLSPKPRGRAIRLPLPDGESAGGEVVVMFNPALRTPAAASEPEDDGGSGRGQALGQAPPLRSLWSHRGVRARKKSRARSIAACLCASPFHGATTSMSGARRAMSAETSAG